MDTEQNWNAVRRRIYNRFYRILDYLSIYLFIIVVYGGALLADYAIFLLMWELLSEEAETYPIVAQILGFARIGLALMSITCAVIHGAISTYQQICMDIELSKEGKRENQVTDKNSYRTKKKEKNEE